MGALKEVILWSCAIILATWIAPSIAESKIDVAQEERDGKVLPIFQVVKFPNDPCTGTSKNGTCYTSEECSNKGGTNEGTCASGFGVCCIFSLSCGDSASQNNTYLSQSSVTSLASPCTYTICPASTNVCRIRFDLSTFVLANAVQGTTVATGGAPTAAASLNGPALGDCATDSFSISGANGGSPVICGTNTGYHMILDTDSNTSNCLMATFNIGGTTTTQRQWDVRVTQYACGDHDSSGWPGCLQYYTATAGNIQNFAFPYADGAAVTEAVTHLENQKYDICIRRASNMCLICYSPTVAAAMAVAAVAATQNSFGVGPSADEADAQAAISSSCVTDWIEIPDGNTAANAAIAAPIAAAAITNISRFCGRVFALAAAATDSVTICSRQLPFRVGVNFDDNEAASVAADAMALSNEQVAAPGGIVGFKLTYWQVGC